MKKRPRIIYNDDSCTLGLVNPPHTPEMIDRAVDYLVGSQVDRISWSFFCSWLAQTWYSQRIENYFDLAEKATGEGASYLQYNAMYSLYQQQIDYLPILIEKFHRHDKEFYAAIRMNDCHLKSEPNGAFSPEFWRHNQDKRLWGVAEGMSYYNAALDYSYDVVRERVFTAIDEILERYPVDGLELDFLRNEFAFNPDEAEAKQPILTNFIARIRQRAHQGNSIAKPVGVMVRLPYDLNRQRSGGMDLESWLAADLVDEVIAGTRSVNIACDFHPMVELCHRYGKAVYGDIQPDVAFNPSPEIALTPDQRVVGHCQFHPFTIDEIAAFSYGMADVFLNGGMDGIYMFNFPCWGNDCTIDGVARGADEIARFNRIMHHIGKWETLRKQTRSYYAWSSLPFYVETGRPARFYQTVKMPMGTAPEEGEVFRFSLRCFSAANPHAYHPEVCSDIRKIMRICVNGKTIPAESISSSAQPAGQVPSGFIIGAHELWNFELNSAEIPSANELKIAFYMPGFPGDDSPYIYIHDLRIVRVPKD